MFHIFTIFRPFVILFVRHSSTKEGIHFRCALIIDGYRNHIRETTFESRGTTKTSETPKD